MRLPHSGAIRRAGSPSATSAATSEAASCGGREVSGAEVSGIDVSSQRSATRAPRSRRRWSRPSGRWCYRRLLAGEAQIAPLEWDLNAGGIRTVSGGLWTRNILRRSLVRPALAGLIEVRGEILGRARSGEPVSEGTGGGCARCSRRVSGVVRRGGVIRCRG